MNPSTQINASEAPQGHKAVADESASNFCRGCAFWNERRGCHNSFKDGVECHHTERADNCDVIFKATA